MRYALALGGVALVGPSWFPWGTFVANVLGSFGLGVVVVLGAGKTWMGSEVTLILGMGVMGGFTTYSAFNVQNLRLIEEGAVGKAAVYMVATVIVCLGAGLAGLTVARALR